LAECFGCPVGGCFHNGSCGFICLF
jgi:hypothetical protein